MTPEQKPVAWRVKRHDGIWEYFESEKDAVVWAGWHNLGEPQALAVIKAPNHD